MTKYAAQPYPNMPTSAVPVPDSGGTVEPPFAETWQPLQRRHAPIPNRAKSSQRRDAVGGSSVQDAPKRAIPRLPRVRSRGEMCARGVWVVVGNFTVFGANPLAAFATRGAGYRSRVQQSGHAPSFSRRLLWPTNIHTERPASFRHFQSRTSLAVLSVALGLQQAGTNRLVLMAQMAQEKGG